MWIDVGTLAAIIGKSRRRIQQMAASGEIQSRKRDAKSIEIYVPSLPVEWIRLVKASGVSVDMTALAPADGVVLSEPERHVVSMATLASKISKGQRRDAAIWTYYRHRIPGKSNAEWIEAVAAYFTVSPSTVRRAIRRHDSDEVDDACYAGSQRTWDPAAIDWMHGYFLTVTHDIGYCSKTTCWKAVRLKAKEMGWAIGCRSAAFRLIGGFGGLICDYAAGGSRAIDNYFYIARDCKALKPMQVIIGDQHIFDYWVADYEKGVIFRPQCYVWLDMCTKVVYGIAFDEDYDSDTVRESLRVGLHCWGAFDCTYNDNGTSEKSRLISSVVDDIIRLRLGASDFSELYRDNATGEYIIEDADGNVIERAKDEKEWYRKHRRIYANVQNAKAKDIERFFSTVNMKLDQKMIAGRCATPGANAAVDKVERDRLERQKDNHQLLDIDEFVALVLTIIKEYQETRHATLGMSPLSYLESRWKGGWRKREIDPTAIDFAMADRCTRKVVKGRIRIGATEFIGEELRAENGVIQDVGLAMHEGENLEVRYLEESMDRALVVVSPTDIRPLKAVEKVVMLDDEAMVKAIEAKKRQMRAIREAFAAFVRPIGSVIIKTPQVKVIRKAEKVMEKVPEISDIDIGKEMEKRLATTGRPTNVTPFRPAHQSRHARFKWCLDMIGQGYTLVQSDKDFMMDYESSEEYLESKAYWDSYRTLAKEV